MSDDVVRLGPPDGTRARRLRALFATRDLCLQYVPATRAIPASYWGAPEAGLRGHSLYVREDTPLHSVLHEACHFLCMDDTRKARLDTDAGGDELEESAVCFLSVLLAPLAGEYDRDRLFMDMDAWGYSFRLGSARAWFDHDAEDARAWLLQRGLIDCACNVILKAGYSTGNSTPSSAATNASAENTCKSSNCSPTPT